MPSPTTAYELIKGAFRRVGITASGETPTADEANDALSDFNDLLELMSTENLFVYGQANETFPTVAGQAAYTIGPAGNFNTTRPVRIPSAYCTVTGIDYPIDVIGPEEYDDISLKTEQQQIIERLAYVNDYPLGRIYLWPTPSAIVSLVLSTDRVLTQVATLTTTITYPPGYLTYMKHALALMIAPDYGVTPDPTVAAIAQSSKANLKRANRIKRVARFDSMIADTNPTSWQSGG